MSDPFEIGVCTAAWGDYGRFLPEWVESIAAQTVRPDVVTVIDAGMTDPFPGALALAASGLTFRWKKIEYRGIGHARNAAVRATETRWISHLDADDVFLPNAIEDTRDRADNADVIALGAWRDGKEWNFRRTTARRVLDGNLSCYSCSPFRRSLWERRPYIEVNDWIDSAFWIGFAHLGARFVGTHRPGFTYRQHPGSHSKTISREDKREAMIQFYRLLKGWDM